MIRILVVEDEPPIARGIIKLIQSYDCGQEMDIQSAINGKRALEQLESAPFDIVFTDIKMPLMTGIELAEQIQKRYPEIITVMISGYQDFDFARKAIQYKVFDYILKPVKKEDMHNLLDHVFEKINSRNLQKNRSDIFRAIQNEAPAPAASHRGETQLYAVLLMCAGAFPLTPDESLLPAISLYSQIDVEQIVESMTTPSEVSMCFNGKSSAERIVVVSVDNPERIHQIARDLMQQLGQVSHLPVTIATNGQLIDLNHLYTTFIKLRTMLHNRLVLFQSNIFCLGENEAQEKDDYVPENKESAVYNEMLVALKTGSKERIHESVLSSLNEFAEQNATQLESIFVFERILSTFFSGNLSGKQIVQAKTDLRTAFSNATTQNSLCDEITEIFCYSLPNEENDEKANSHQHLCDNIESYLKANYDKNITNTLLSQEFGFVSSYISKIFREHKGMSPSEYLTNFRIGMAKEILTSQPETLVKEVARTVGFNDQHYFSKIFKRETGMWPTEFQGQK